MTTWPKMMSSLLGMFHSVVIINKTIDSKHNYAIWLKRSL